MPEQPKPYQVRPHTVGSAYTCPTCQHNHVAGCSYGAINTTGGQHACPNFVEHADVPIPSSLPISPPSPAETPNLGVKDRLCVCGHPRRSHRGADFLEASYCHSCSCARFSEQPAPASEDTARLDWLERTGGYVTRYNAPMEGWQAHWETNDVTANGEYYGATARDAIDAARARHEPAPPTETQTATPRFPTQAARGEA